LDLDVDVKEKKKPVVDLDADSKVKKSDLDIDAKGKVKKDTKVKSPKYEFGGISLNVKTDPDTGFKSKVSKFEEKPAIDGKTKLSDRKKHEESPIIKKSDVDIDVDGKGKAKKPDIDIDVGKQKKADVDTDVDGKHQPKKGIKKPGKKSDSSDSD